jgi:hypothetical protein
MFNMLDSAYVVESVIGLATGSVDYYMGEVRELATAYSD